MFQGLFKKTKYITVSSHDLGDIKKEELVKEEQKPNIPNGMWVKCKKCGQIIYTRDLKENHRVCGFCRCHFRLPAYQRIKDIIDDGTWQEINNNVYTLNPLNFEGYEEKISELRKNTGLREAVVTGIGKINGEKTLLCVMDSRFLMGSMGSVVGEKITRTIEKAVEESLPLIIFTASGGARMQEGMYSLMQMAKVSSALSRLKEKGLLYISVLTDPTTGGVTASFAMLGDIILSEPGALIGFAGKRVIEQTIKEKLPEEFQTAEFLLEHGFIDKIVERKNLKDTLYSILRIHSKKEKSNDLYIKEKKTNEGVEIVDKLSPWQKVNMVRNSSRPTSLDYIDKIFDYFVELHGDRYFGDDQCIIGGIGFLQEVPVTVIAQQKGKDLKDNIKRNFGMPNPEGYRKALRLMKQAERFNRPIVCFIDTPGAYCGVGAEERGQGEAIARNLIEMSNIKVPVISIVIGEGGSGGALALTVADKIWMLQNSIYSILSPEGFASILWKDAKRAEEASDIMKITSKDLLDFRIIDKMIGEPKGDASESIEIIINTIKEELIKSFIELRKLSLEELLDNRYKKYRNIGVYGLD
ncbi:acetyl-CoA carboxylase carboxyltransferase subunit alpha [Clostridium sp. MSJ-11]|uniref:Multifunctional fusion protein n=1 Tax=Clostridium mobile TaxID=2841512 RepID=A0ABS6EM94_9CLOT|nr:acetyl-CoA carboxylase carboxyltransferase subunit alpha [Clostridium mobile]MBU5486349.1 acetyl-CoA carboxylase carboxyltransferase subunit alpha [Clostridium mobile]